MNSKLLGSNAGSSVTSILGVSECSSLNVIVIRSHDFSTVSISYGGHPSQRLGIPFHATHDAVCSNVLENSRSNVRAKSAVCRRGTIDHTAVTSRTRYCASATTVDKSTHGLIDRVEKGGYKP